MGVINSDGNITKLLKKIERETFSEATSRSV